MATRPDAAGASARRAARIDRQKCGAPCAGNGESGAVETTTRTPGARPACGSQSSARPASESSSLSSPSSSSTSRPPSQSPSALRSQARCPSRSWGGLLAAPAGLSRHSCAQRLLTNARALAAAAVSPRKRTARATSLAPAAARSPAASKARANMEVLPDPGGPWTTNIIPPTSSPSKYCSIRSNARRTDVPSSRPAPARSRTIRMWRAHSSATPSSSTSAAQAESSESRSVAQTSSSSFVR